MIFIVTGGAGFISSNLVNKLISLNHTVKVIDNFSSGFADNLVQHDNLTIYNYDVCNYKDIIDIIKDANFVVHLAGFVSVPLSSKFPLENNRINVDGFLSVLEACKNTNIKKLIYASSAAVYGDNEDIKHTEARIGLPISPYALTKQVDEQYAYFYRNQYQVNAIGLRFFNVYGTNQIGRDMFCGKVAYYLNRALQNKTIYIKGDGTETRNFVYVDDVVNIIISLCLTDVSADYVYNISSNNSISLNYLIELIKHQLNSSSEVIYLESNKGDIKHSNADNTKIKALFNYTFRNIEEVFTYENFRKFSRE